MNIVPNSKVTFREYLEQMSQDASSLADDFFASHWHDRPVGVQELLDGIEWPDILLSPAECAKLNIPANSSYADAVRAIRKMRAQQKTLQ